MSQSGRHQRRRKDLIEHLRGKTHLSEGEQGLLAADKAIEQLGTRSPRCAQALELEVFHRMSPRRIARALNRSEDTINRDLRIARAKMRLNMLSESETEE